MARILHLDTSAAKAIVALGESGTLIGSKAHDGERDGAGVINRLIDETLRDARWDISTLDAIAVCAGPGSYTGLRIALATAKGFTYALDIPLVAHDRLYLGLKFALAAAPSGELYIAILPARAGEYFIAAQGMAEPLLQPQLMTTAQVSYFMERCAGKRIVVWGKYSEDHASFFINEKVSVLPFIHPDLPVWIAETKDYFEKKIFSDPAILEPAYLKQVYIQLPEGGNKG